MRFEHRFLMECLCVVALSGGLVACTKTGDDDSGNTTQTGTGGMVAPGTGGMVAPGTGGMAAPGTGGMTAPGTGGMTAPGTGGMTAPGTGGMTAPGTGGMASDDDGGMTMGGGTGGMGGGDQCAAAVVADDPNTTMQCAACLCMNCNAEVTAMKGDDKAKALLNCGKTKMCSGTCCLCGKMTCGLDNYETGPCADEVETAAGVPVKNGDAITYGSMLMTNCGMTGNSCNKPAVLSDCTAMHCMTDCPMVAACTD